MSSKANLFALTIAAVYAGVRLIEAIAYGDKETPKSYKKVRRSIGYIALGCLFASSTLE